MGKTTAPRPKTTKKTKSNAVIKHKKSKVPLRPGTDRGRAGKSETYRVKAPDNAASESRRRASKKRRQMFYAVMVVFLTFYTVSSLAVFLFYYYSFNRTFSKAQVFAVDIIGERGRSIAFTDVSRANKAYGLYVSLTDLDKLCDFSVAGDDKALTLMLRGSGETLECFANSSFMYINGTPARLSAPILYEDREYYIPVELLEQYFSGFDILYEKGVCAISLAKENGGVLELKFKTQKVSEPIPEITGDTSPGP